MKKPHCNFIKSFLCIGVLFATLVVAANEAPTIEYKIPCLTVSGLEGNGKLSYLPFYFQKTNENKPFRIAITDDTPNGSGEEIHSNLWLAAVTAAMLRNETLHGCKLTVEFQGAVDGPSAGAVCCLAILSAIDRQSLPDDFAMTGTIFPDGTIGIVGGVAEKIKAAARNGKTRILIPGFQRMEKNSDGKLVDLVRLAEYLNVKVFPVENIEEAYAIVHNKQYTKKNHTEPNMAVAIPAYTENVLKRKYYKYANEIPVIIRRLSAECLDYITPLCEDDLNLENLFREGKFLAAVDCACDLYRILIAAEKTWPHYSNWEEPVFGSKNKKLAQIHNDNVKFYKQSYNKRIEQQSHDFVTRYEKNNYVGYVPKAIGLSPITAQFECIEDEAAYRAVFNCFNNLHELIQTKKLSSDEFHHAKLLEFFYRIFGEAMSVSEKDEMDYIIKLSNTLPHKYPNPIDSKIESLFKTAQIATIQAAASVAQHSSAENANYNLNWYTAAEISLMAHSANRDIEKASFRDYHIQVSLKLQIAAFVKGAVLLAQQYQDSSSDFLKYLIRNARNSALNNINECIAAKVPCIEPLRAFQVAESTEYKQDNLMYILENYWYASLYSKTLVLCFK